VPAEDLTCCNTAVRREQTQPWWGGLGASEGERSCQPPEHPCARCWEQCRHG